MSMWCVSVCVVVLVVWSEGLLKERKRESEEQRRVD